MSYWKNLSAEKKAAHLREWIAAIELGAQDPRRPLAWREREMRYAAELRDDLAALILYHPLSIPSEATRVSVNPQV